MIQCTRCVWAVSFGSIYPWVLGAKTHERTTKNEQINFNRFLCFVWNLFMSPVHPILIFRLSLRCDMCPDGGDIATIIIYPQAFQWRNPCSYGNSMSSHRMERIGVGGGLSSDEKWDSRSERYQQLLRWWSNCDESMQQRPLGANRWRDESWKKNASNRLRIEWTLIRSRSAAISSRAITE